MPADCRSPNRDAILQETSCGTKMPFRTRLTEIFNLQFPIILAPMAGISGGSLATAVSRAGGFGFIGGGYGDRAWLVRELDVAGDVGVGIGFISWSLAKTPDLLSVALDRRPRAIFLSFGDIEPFANKIAKASVPLIAQVQTVEDAKAAVDQGAAVIVAQGTEAGGHGGSRATMALVPSIIDAIGDVPVVAAGGIADGRGVAAALGLGASGAVCGTAFVASREALVYDNVKSAVVAASGDNTVRSSVFDIVRGLDWPQRWTVRTLQNDFFRRWADTPELLHDNIEQRKAYKDAQSKGDVATAAVIVGEVVDLIRGIEPAGDILRRMGDDAEKRVRAMTRLIA
jgi:nitronate monooxygenase